MFIILNEVTFENKDIEKMQDAVTELRQTKYTDKAKTKKALDNLGEKISKTFNCKVTMEISGNSYLDAYTYAVYADVSSDPVKGFKFTDNNTELYISITRGLLYSKEFSDREITAIFLHEIGHNFYKGTIDLYSNRVLFDAKSAKDFKKLKEITDKAKDKESKSTNLAVNKGLTAIHDQNPGFIEKLRRYFEFIADNPLNIIRVNAMLFVINANKYEAFADEFAASYGYRKDLATVLLKIENNHANNLSNNFKGILHINEILYKIIFFILGWSIYMPLFSAVGIYKLNDEPETRLIGLISNLKAELRNCKDMPPKQREKYEKQVKELEEMAHEQRWTTLDHTLDNPAFTGYYAVKSYILSRAGKYYFGNTAYKVINSLSGLNKK